MSARKFSRGPWVLVALLAGLPGPAVPKPAKRAQYTPDVLERVRKEMLEHPELDLDALAKRLRGHPTRGSSEWTRSKVEALVGHGKLPGRLEREQALSQRIAEWLGAHSGIGSFLEARDAILTRFGIEPAQLLRLIKNHSVLADPLRKLPLAPPPDPAVTELHLDMDTARELGIQRVTIGKLVGEPRLQAIWQRITEALREFERKEGDRDGFIEPRDVDRAKRENRGEPWIIDLLDGIFATQRKTLSISQIRRRLPDFLSNLFAHGRLQDHPRLRGLYLEIAAASVLALSDAYREAVLQGSLGTISFRRRWHLEWAPWEALQEHFSSLFPAPRPIPIGELAALYEQLLSGEITIGYFMKRGKIDAQTFRQLVALHSDRFPRGSSSRYIFSGGSVGKPWTAREVEALARAFSEQVIEQRKTVEEFVSGQKLGEKTFRKLREENEALFSIPDPMSPFAKALGARLMKIYRDDPLLFNLTRALEQINAEPSFVAAFGRIDTLRYKHIRAKEAYRGLFPPIRTAERTQQALATLAQEIHELLGANPSFGMNAVVQKMKKKHPGFNAAHYEQVRDQVPELTRRYRRGRFRSRGAAVYRPLTAVPMLRLFELALEIAPPDLAPAAFGSFFLKRMVEDPAERHDPILLYKELAMRSGRSVLERRAGPVSELLAEYAQAAPAGQSETDILHQVREHYPRLTPSLIGLYAKLWRERPSDFPALEKFYDRAQRRFVLEGQRAPGPRRYRGGWDFERLLDTVDPATQMRWAHAAQVAQIPMHMKLVTERVDALKGQKPLAGHNFVWVTHLLGSNYPLARALRKAGLSPARTYIVGTPYGSHEAMSDILSEEGFSVNVPELSVRAYRDAVKAALKQAIELHRVNQQPITVLDDGGLVADILHEDPEEYAEFLSAIKIVEQTTRGITEAEKQAMRVPIINVAGSLSKGAEAPLIGRTVVAKVAQGLARLGRPLKGMKATVIGYGMGEFIARELAKAGADVTVVEASSKRAEEAAKDFAVLPKDRLREALARSDLIIGATGKQALGARDFAFVKRGAVVASASSKQDEADMAGLGALAKRRVLPASSPFLKLPTAVYTLKETEFTFLGDGWPINFDGDMNSVPPEEIQLTRATMFAGVLQAVDRSMSHKRGVVALDEDVDLAIRKRFLELRAAQQEPPVTNPDDWRRVLISFANGLARQMAGGPR